MSSPANKAVNPTQPREATWIIVTHCAGRTFNNCDFSSFNGSVQVLHEIELDLIWQEWECRKRRRGCKFQVHGGERRSDGKKDSEWLSQNGRDATSMMAT